PTRPGRVRIVANPNGWTASSSSWRACWRSSERAVPPRRRAAAAGARVARDRRNGAVRGGIRECTGSAAAPLQHACSTMAPRRTRPGSKPMTDGPNEEEAEANRVLRARVESVLDGLRWRLHRDGADVVLV